MRPLTFASLIVVAALACQREPVSPRSAKGLTLTLALAQTELQRGEPDSVVMTLTNTNRHYVSLSGGACEPRAYVRDASGVTVVPQGGDWFCIAVLRSLVLAPGERYTHTFVWQTGPFTPGNYSVHATFAAEGVTLATPPASVRVN
jgi:intracellular proteinase inhibitor BsuPI